MPHVIDKPRDWKPLTYCWRGGKRSGSLSLILSEIGFNVRIIDGGYKAFRAALVEDIPRLVETAQLHRHLRANGFGQNAAVASFVNYPRNDDKPAPKCSI